MSDAPYSNLSTSKAAAQSIQSELPFLERKVLAFINARGSHGATCFEVEAGLALTHQTASARINGLARKSMTMPLATTRTAPSGRQAQVWVSRETADEIQAEQGREAFPSDLGARETKASLRARYLDLVGLLVPILDVVNKVDDLTAAQFTVHITQGSGTRVVSLKGEDLQALMNHLNLPMGN